MVKTALLKAYADAYVQLVVVEVAELDTSPLALNIWGDQVVAALLSTMTHR
jgi:hypothetical protein